MTSQPSNGHAALLAGHVSDQETLGTGHRRGAWPWNASVPAPEVYSGSNDLAIHNRATLAGLPTRRSAGRGAGSFLPAERRLDAVSEPFRRQKSTHPSR